MARKPSQTPKRPPPRPRGPFVVAFGLALAGLVVAALLARIHSQAHAGIESFCTVSDVVNCDRVATSPYSVFLGLPVAVWGLIGYAAAAAASGWGLAARRPHPRWPAGLLFLLAAPALEEPGRAVGVAVECVRVGHQAHVLRLFLRAQVVRVGVCPLDGPHAPEQHHAQQDADDQAQDDAQQQRFGRV